MSNGAISWRDYCQDDTDGVPALNGNAGTSSLAFDAAYPGANALTADPSQVARINYTRNGTANTDITVSCVFSASDTGTLRVLAALNVRLPSRVTAVVQVRASALNTSGATLETGTTYLAADMVPVPGTTDRYNFFWILSTEQMGARADFLFRFNASTSGYFEIGRLWAGPAVVWPNGAGMDWSLSGMDGSRVQRSDGGGYASYSYPVRTVMKLSKQAMSYLDSFGAESLDTTAPVPLSIRNLMFEAGTSEPVIAISTDADKHKAQVQSVYGLVTQMAELNNLGAGLYGTGMVVQQIR